MLLRQTYRSIHKSPSSPARIPHLASSHPRSISTTPPKMSPSNSEKQTAKDNGHSSSDVEGKNNEWKFRAPYKVHENDPDFKALYEGGCHCGRVKYQLSREKPLDAKYCHCGTCQVLHGVCSLFLKSSPSKPGGRKREMQNGKGNRKGTRER